MPRLFVCQDCRTIDVFPLLDGKQATTAVEDANRDPLLNELTNRHLQKHVMNLVDPVNPAAGFEKARVFVVEERLWNVPEYQTSVLRNIRDQWSGFEPSLYAVKDTFQEDALKCFSRHSRPKGSCIDWKDSSKLLTPTSWHSELEETVDTADLRKGYRSFRRNPKKAIYLCDFCPVAAFYRRKGEQ